MSQFSLKYSRVLILFVRISFFRRKPVNLSVHFLFRTQTRPSWRYLAWRTRRNGSTHHNYLLLISVDNLQHVRKKKKKVSFAWRVYQLQRQHGHSHYWQWHKSHPWKQTYALISNVFSPRRHNFVHFVEWCYNGEVTYTFHLPKPQNVMWFNLLPTGVHWYMACLKTNYLNLENI